MFNRASPFNRLTYNRPLTVFVYGSATLHGSGGMTAAANVDMTGSARLEGEGSLSADFVREIVFAARMDAESSMSVSFIRERMQSAVLHGIGTLKANGSRYHVDEITFTGPFKPGDKIVIDSGKMTITQNGVNALSLLAGDFFDLNLGNNELTYTDPETGRDILIRISYRDKYLY
ncbi:phage distal tail protein [Paenibacillus tuaregi]|uniref:phage distal tail protein n=1 Tax=Paenibacillus tuaregi TaxID=1816681 RepID=UPI000837B767|nr:phage tail domain-containing protein [Paenibacillus tuaregi]